MQVLPEDSSSKGEDVVQETLQSSGSHISLRSFSEAAAATAWENLMASATGPGAVLPSPYAGLSFLETLPDITNWGEVLALLAADIKTC